MEQFIENLNTTTFNKNLLKEIFKKNFYYGFHENCERMLILKSSLQYLGYPYNRTEELHSETIDCSTLTSQSYWEGAAIRIPFVAENQRSSNSGKLVDITLAKPADIVVKYSNLDQSPDKTFNHVGLLLGSDTKNNFHVIESNSVSGCVVSTLEKFDPKGGIKRYIRNDEIPIETQNFQKISQISKLVPKLSRIWSKQYNIYDSSIRYTHKGIDIYLPIKTVVRSPINGKISSGTLDNEFSSFVMISNEEINLNCLLGNIVKHHSLSDGIEVLEGDIIGEIVAPAIKSLVKYAKLDNSNTHLHFEVFGDIVSNYDLYYYVDGQKYYNPLYLAKLDIIKLPV